MPLSDIALFWNEPELSDIEGDPVEWRPRMRQTPRETEIARMVGPALKDVRLRRQRDSERKRFTLAKVAEYMTRKTGEKWTTDTVNRMECGAFLPNGLEFYLLRWYYRASMAEEFDEVLMRLCMPAAEFAAFQNRYQDARKELRDARTILQLRMLEDPNLGKMAAMHLRHFLKLHAKAMSLYDQPDTVAQALEIA